MTKRSFIRPALATASVALISLAALPALATTNYTFPGSGGAFDAVVSTTKTWSVGIGGSLGGQRMLIDMAGTNTVTITIQGTQGGTSVNMSNAECSWDANSTVTTLTLGGQTSATLTSTPSAGSVDCTLTRQTIIGSEFYVRVPGSPTRISGRIPFYLNNYGSSGSSSAPRSAAPAPKYSGPEFESFGAAVVVGDKVVSKGKRLDGITSLTVNGSTVSYKINSASELEITLPKTLAPGKYDVEITSAHGKLTHLQAITVKAPVLPKTFEFKGDGRSLGYDELLELTKIAKQIGSEYTSVQCIVNASDASVAQRLVDRGCDYVGAIRLRGKEITTEAKSTYKGDGFWFKIVANG